MEGFFKKMATDLKKVRNIPLLLITVVLATLKPLNDLFEMFKQLPLPVTVGGIYLALLILLLYILKRKDRYSDSERRITRISLYCLSAVVVVYGVWYSIELYNKSRKKQIARDQQQGEILAHQQKINILTSYFSRDSMQDSFSPQLIIELNDKIRNEKDVVIERAHGYFEDISNVESTIIQAFSTANSTKGIFAYGDYTPIGKRLACKIYLHNLLDSISIADSTHPGSSFTIKIPQKYNIDFGEQVTMAANFIVALFYQCIGKNDQASAILEKLQADTTISLSLKYAALRASGDNALVADNYSKAISYYNEAKQINPKTELDYRSAVAYYANKEYLAANLIASNLDDQKLEFSDFKNKAALMAVNTKVEKNGIIVQDGKFALKLNDNMLTDSVENVKEYSLNGKRYFVLRERNASKVIDESGAVLNNLPKGLRKYSQSAPPPVQY